MPEKAIVAVDEIIARGNAPAWAYLLRSEAFLATGKLGRALSDLHMAMDVEPDVQTEQRIKALQSVIEFRNLDMLNP
ncbi:hypothetical protein [uncultured Muribaculum sp.]|uniref:tetratricopeptide repeat protein n=1 Tax=uncultured Muribaculum sp. TaxID=1918613 RepID=UPI0025DEBC7B|nr:hypothetical protein [uncultured Muribaculum sp.]